MNDVKIKTFDKDPSRIRKCVLLYKDDKPYIQFIAVGNKHKMMREEDGSINIIQLPEQGLDFNYGDPVPADEAIDILHSNHHPSHREMARMIEFNMNSVVE